MRSIYNASRLRCENFQLARFYYPAIACVIIVACFFVLKKITFVELGELGEVHNGEDRARLQRQLR